MNWKKIPIGTIIFFLFFLKILSSSGYCKNIELSAPPVEQQIKLDGKLTDWPEEATYFLGEPEATMGVCHDSVNIYILVSFRKPEWARQVRRSGLTVWLDAKGKKNKDFMLRFTDGPTREEMKEIAGMNEESQQREMPAGMQERMAEMDKKLENGLVCFQKDYLAEKPIPMDGSQGPAAAFGIDKGFFVYEFRIPLQASSAMHYGLGVAPDQVLGVGLTWGGFDREKMRESRRDMGNGPPGMGGGMAPGGMGGDMPMGGGGRRGGPGGRPGDDQALQKQEVWLKVKMAATAPNEASTNK